jgi:hypothetical protein
MAGLVNLLNTAGSVYSYNGQNPANQQAERDVVIGDKKDSRMHYVYSTTGNPGTLASSLPQPSGLDINATLLSTGPLGPLQDPSNPQFGSGYSNGTYRNSCPIEGVGRI